SESLSVTPSSGPGARTRLDTIAQLTARNGRGCRDRGRAARRSVHPLDAKANRSAISPRPLPHAVAREVSAHCREPPGRVEGRLLLMEDPIPTDFRDARAVLAVIDGSR